MWLYQLKYSQKLEVGNNCEERCAVSSYSIHCDVICGGRGDRGNVEGYYTGPRTWVYWLNIWKVFVVNKCSKNTTLKVKLTDINWLGPNSSQHEIDCATELRWVWVSIGLTIVHQKVSKIVNLFEFHWIRDSVWGIKELVYLVLNLIKVRQMWHSLLLIMSLDVILIIFS